MKIKPLPKQLFKYLFIALLTLPSTALNAQTFNDKLEVDDVSDALKMLGLEVFKYNFDSINQDYQLLIHIDEIANDSIITSKSFKFRNWNAEQKNKEIKFISKIASDNADTYWIKIVHPKMVTTVPFNIAEKYRHIHHWQQIKKGPIEYNRKTPLLFYGMAWEDEYNGKKFRRFCWGEEIGRDLSNKTLKKVEHMILISYELIPHK
ncbi:MAG: DUF5041 domain-containing protein [Labilibaculum sp.]|nr:DUF5041 domain-containing protein [Labilibaculum sp.]MBI9058460.1 DUF5041 domain-containing protein [Labilibaculum sp.]